MSSNYVNPHLTTLSEYDAFKIAEQYQDNVNYPYMDEIYKILVSANKSNIVYGYLIDEHNVHQQAAFQALKTNIRCMVDYAMHYKLYDIYRVKESARNILKTPINTKQDASYIMHWIQHIEYFKEEMVQKLIDYNSPQIALEFYNHFKTHKNEMIKIIVNGDDSYCVSTWLIKYPEDIELLMPYYRFIANTKHELSTNLEEFITYFLYNRESVKSNLLDEIFNVVLRVGSLDTFVSWIGNIDHKDNYKLKLVILRHNKVNNFIDLCNQEIMDSIDVSTFEDDEVDAMEEYIQSELYTINDFYVDLPDEYQLGVIL